mmetsp:Transcript_23917/g.77150  ORF Transcript_23917/g.77150 Transcript_23917/m.77150 type:complete len:89 (-) Transcript_23917:120-386(-)
MRSAGKRHPSGEASAVDMGTVGAGRRRKQSRRNGPTPNGPLMGTSHGGCEGGDGGECGGGRGGFSGRGGDAVDHSQAFSGTSGESLFR